MDINFLPHKKTEPDEELGKPAPSGEVEFHVPKEEKETSGGFKKVSSIFQGLLARLRPKKKSKPKQAKPAKEAAKPKPHEPKKILVTQPELEEQSLVDINLMPWRDPNRQRKKILRISLVVGSLLIVLTWGAQLRIKNSARQTQFTGLQNSLANVEAKLEGIDETLLAEGSGVALRQRKLTAILETLPRWSKLISLLEAHTDNEVFYEILGVEDQGKITLDARAASFEAAARQYQTYREATSWLASVAISDLIKEFGADGQVDSIRFSIDLEIKPEVLQEEVSLGLD